MPRNTATPLLAILIVMIAVMLWPAALMAQSQSFQGKARAIDGTSLQIGAEKIFFWGVRGVGGASAQQQINARITLDALTHGQDVRCESKFISDKGQHHAQCINVEDKDMGLAMVQAGFATVDRASVFGTVFEQPYITAETQARDTQSGIWADNQGSGYYAQIIVLLAAATVLIGLIEVLAILYFGRVMAAGFEKLRQEQAYHSELFAKEQKLKAKESSIIASMLEAEIKSNRARIEAFVLVYDEMLKEIRDVTKKPKYKMSGDIVQLQPGLERAIFDTHTAKIEALGPRLSSALVHFYARIKSKPEYTNLEPEMPQHEAIKTVEVVINNARKLQEIADGLLVEFRRQNADGRKSMPADE